MSFIPGANVGPYRIVEQTDRAGSASTYTAYQPSLGRYVSITVLPSVARDDVSLLRWRQRQLDRVVGLRHPSILTVLDHGEHEDQAFLVTELVDAEPLSDRLGAPWPLAEAVRVLRPIAAALDHAHEQGIVHGDIRPATIVLAPDGTSLLSGFGLAVRSVPDEVGAGVGGPGQRGLSVADEVERGQQTDRRSLALVAYEMLTGRVVDVDAADIERPLPPARLGGTLLAPHVEQALLRELTGDPRDRYPTASAMLADLAEPGAAPLPISAPSASPARADELQRRWLTVALIVAAVGILGAAVALARGGLLTSGPGQSAAQSPPASGPAAVVSPGTSGAASSSGSTASAPGTPGTATPGGQPGSASAPAGAPTTTGSTGASQARTPVAGSVSAGSAPATPGPAATAAADATRIAADVTRTAGAPAVVVPGGTVPATTPILVPTPTPPAVARPTNTASAAGAPPAAPPATAATGPGRIPPAWRVTGDPSGRWTQDAQGRVTGQVESGTSLLLFPESVQDVDFSAVVGATNCQATLVFGAQDDEDLMFSIYIPDGLPNPTSTAGGVWLYQRVEGVDIPIRAVRQQAMPRVGDPARFRIVTSGSQITISLDDRTMIQAVDTTPRAGRLGLMVYSTGGRPCEATFGEIRR